MNKNIEKDFVIGGSIDKALSGNYELNMFSVLGEAWKHTIRHFLSFSPAIIALLAVQLVIFYLALKLQIGDPALILQMFDNPELIEQGIFEAIFVANFSYEVISAPIYAGVSLMAMSHSAGLMSKPQHILKGLQFTVPVIIATLFSLVLQGIGGMLIPLLSMYLSVAFSNSILLICEKKISPIQSLWISFRAVNKKLFPIIGLYTIMMVLLFVAAISYGFLLVVVLPLFFHMKGIIYRNMFGITLKIIAPDVDNTADRFNNHSDKDDSNDDDDDSHDDNDSDDNNDSTDEPVEKDKSDKGSQIFNA